MKTTETKVRWNNEVEVGRGRASRNVLHYQGSTSRLNWSKPVGTFCKIWQWIGIPFQSGNTISIFFDRRNFVGCVDKFEFKIRAMEIRYKDHQGHEVRGEKFLDPLSQQTLWERTGPTRKCMHTLTQGRSGKCSEARQELNMLAFSLSFWTLTSLR